AAQGERDVVVAGAPGDLGVEGAGDVADGGHVQRVVAASQVELEVDVAGEAAGGVAGLVCAAKGERGLVVALARLQRDVQRARDLPGHGHAEGVVAGAQVGRHTQLRVDGTAEGQRGGVISALAVDRHVGRAVDVVRDRHGKRVSAFPEI